MTNVRWHVVALLVLASFVAYLLRTNMSVAGERMMEDLGLTKVQLGFVLAAFAWGYAIFQFPGGVFGDRFGGRRALALIAASWGCLNLLVGLVPAGAMPATAILGTLIVLRFLMGVAQAPLYPITGGGVIYHWFPPTSWALPNGLTNAGLTLGAAATGPLIAWLAATVGWRQSFLLTAPAAFLVAAVWWWYVRDRPSEHAGVSAKEIALIDAGRHATSAAAEAARRADWRSVIRNRNVLLLAGSYFCSNYVFYFFFNWLFIYLVDVRGFKALEGGYFAAAPWLAGAVGAAAGGLLADQLAARFGPRQGYRIPTMIALVAVGGLIFAAATAHNPVVAVIYLSLCLGLQQMTEGSYWAATIAVSGRHAATGCGVLNTGGNVVGGIGALLVPITAQRFGWVPALGTASIFALVGAVLWVWIRADEQVNS
jgi:ACS family glucarate transporter-like MFS transporter